MVDYEEKCLNAYIQSLKPEELQDLSQPLWLVAAIEPKGSLNNRIQVPKKIRLMLKLVDDLLKADETQVELNLFISMAKLQFVVKYCQFFDYIKERLHLASDLLIQEMDDKLKMRQLATESGNYYKDPRIDSLYNRYQ